VERLGFASLLTAARNGDEQAFLEIFRSVQPGLLRLLRTLCGDLAEDVASDTWLGVIQGLHRFDGDEQSFWAWVYSIARARRIDRLRAEGRRPPTVDIYEVAEAELPHRDEVAEAVDYRMSTDTALRLIGALPPDQAEVILLRVVAGLDVAHTARVVGKRPGTVRVLAHRGLRRLAEVLERP
jgi:RNA polymerase sigma-70 factor, ECF subfamily